MVRNDKSARPHAQTTRAAAGSAHPDPEPNHALIFGEIKAFVDRQHAQMDALDTKAGLVAATSTALTAGFLAMLHAGAGGRSATGAGTAGLSDRTLLIILFAVAFAAYVVVIAGLYMAVRLRAWRIVPDPAVLLDEYWQATADHTTADLCATMVAAVEQNGPALDDKLKWVGRSYLLLGIDVAILFAASLVAVWAGLV